MRTIYKALNKTPVPKTLLGQAHKVLKMALVTSECTFSALKAPVHEEGLSKHLPPPALS